MNLHTLMDRTLSSGRLLPAPSPNSRVALIGQDPCAARLITTLLADEGWEALTCNVHDPHAFIHGQECEVILVDVDGVPPEQPLVDLLMLDPKTSRLPMVVCTSYPERLGFIGRRLSLRGVELLPKPFTADDLYAALRMVVSKARGGADRAGRGTLT